MEEGSRTRRASPDKARPIYVAIVLAICTLPESGVAADFTMAGPSQPVAEPNPIADYFAHWYDRVDYAYATQPHWMTPITTVTPRLEEEYRYDQTQSFLGNRAEVNNFFNGKGFELIPTTTNEVLINVPGFQERTTVKPATGFVDANLVTIKQRILSANEENGNYILSTFLGFTAPTGVPAFTNHTWIVTPTIAGGIGWGDFDVQGTVAFPIPTDNVHVIGTSVASSVTLQYHFWDYFWPEWAFNDIQWLSGERVGKNQLTMGPGIIFGRFPLFDRVKLNIGFSYQFAVAPSHTTLNPVLTPQFKRQYILTMRFPF